MRILVTGGAGFIGSNLVDLLLATRQSYVVTVLDLLTYAGNLENLARFADHPRFSFARGDIADAGTVARAMDGVDAVVNLAAESHVDRSILDAAPFLRTNILGTQVLLEAAREAAVGRFLHVSTDEVYGSLAPDDPPFTEESCLAPNSPYSASKAAADCLVRAYTHTHGLPALTLRSSNAYGPYQFPEKLIPLTITNACAGRMLPVYGDGLQVRDWVHVADLCDAILEVLEHGRTAETYNVGGGTETPNIAVVETIVALTGADPALIRFVEDRPGHDRRYAMNHRKLTAELGWTPARTLADGLAETVSWYREHEAWVASVRSGAYQEYYDRQYAHRLAAPVPGRRPPSDPA